ncbi:phosphatidylinositol 3-kinase [Angomonas deanei]|nr:phosphatidylinositol 3-kinase [Angomonas deanei]|eukprot:EPY30775.1 phosphatidylinositol 3-kinase [Angomonas deanei]
MPSLQVALQEALDKVVDNTLHLPDQTTETPATTGSRHHCALHDSTVPANPFKTRSAGVSSLVELVDTSHVESDPLITAPSSSTGPPDNSTTVPSAPNQGDLTVALRAFSRRPVLSVQHLDDIKNKIIPFQRHEDVLVREASSTAVVQGLNQWVLFAKNTKTTTYSTRVTDILDIFVKNVLSEMDPDCRLKEIALLTEAVNLRPFLSDPRILPSLLSSLTGPQSIHEKTVELLVSLTLDSKSSSSVQAVQQNLLVIIESSVVVLEYTHEVRTLIRSLTDLQTFTRLCVRPLSNHLGRIFYALKKNLKEDNIADVVILSILKTLDVILITLAGEEKTVLQYQDDVAELYSPIVSILKESCSPSLSHAAVSVLVSMNRMCAPLQQQQGATHQQELIHVLTHLFTSTNHLAKDELLNMLTLLGQIGAVDPASNAVLVRPKKKEDATVQDEADMELTYDYTVIVYRTLSRMLDMTLPDAVCSQALRTLLQYMRFTQDKKDLVGGVHAVRAVLQIARRSSDSPALRIEALNVLSAITTLRHERIARLVLPEIVVLLEQLWVPSDFILFRCVLEVVSALKPGKLSGKEQSESWAWLYPRLVDVALQDHTETREFSLRVVEIILNASYIPPHCIPIVFPMLIHFVQQPEQLVEVRGQSLCAAVHIVCDLKVVQYFSSLMHGMRTLVRHCQVNEDLGPRLSTAGVRESLKVLTALHPTGRSVIKQLRDRLSDTDERSSGAGYNNNVFGRRQIPTSSSAATPYYPGDEIISDEDEESASIIHTINSNGSAPELSLLWRHVEWGLRMKENKLREWFAELQKLIIIVSPSPAFRMMVDLFDKHEPLRRELFHPSFKLLYETITADQMKKINDVLTIALNSNDSELSSKCLALSDYLDHHQPSIKAEVLEQLRDHRGVGTPETETNTIRSTHSLTQTQQSEEELTISRRFGDHFGSKEDHTNKQDEGSFVFDSEHNSPADGPPQQKPTHRTSHTRVSGALRRGEEDRFDSNLFNMFQPLSQSFSNFHKHADPSSDAVLTHGNSNSSVAQYASLQAAAASAAHIPFRPNVLFSTENIVKAAERTNMYDKAVSYIENKVHIALKTYRYHRMPKEVIQKIVWPLAWLYSQREMHDSVVGLFHAIRYEGEDNDGFGFELLRWWNKAQQVYTKTVNVEMIRKGMDPSMVEGYVRTLCFCGNWNKALQVAQEACFKSAAPPSSNVAVCGAMSAWMLGKWEAVDQLAEAITERNNGPVRMFFLNGSLLRSALQEKSPAVLEELRQSLSQSKIAMEDSTRTLLSISYSHAYDNLTMVQHFTEMDEIIDYSLSKTPKAQQQLLDRWTARFKQLKRDSLLPSLRSIMLYSLVLRSTDMSEMVLHFCETLGKDYPQLTHWAMDWLCKDNTEGGEENADITVGYITHLWGHGKRREAVSRMESFLNESGERLIETNSECYGKAQLRLGMWKQELNADSFWKRGSREEKLQHFHKAIRAAPSNYEAWHSWGLINYRVQQRDHTLTPEEQHTFVEAAHEGFVAAICRCKDSFEALPGIMRLLQLWVIHNGVSLLKEGVADSISRISIDHWVLAIPQLIGHLSNESHDVREVICMILRTLCEVHPQAVIFPLIVVLMSDEMQSNPSPMQKRKQAIVQTIIQYCPKRIRNEAETVAKLLGDVSAIPIEKIRENLSQVATAWNPNAEYEEDVDEVMYRLQNTMDIFEANVKHLLYTVGNIGKYVQGIVEDYKKGNKEKAAGIVNQLVDEISKHVQDKLGKEPQKALEPLLRLRNLSIAVFGTYDFAEKEFPTIASFSSKLDVIPSKKRPRRIQLNGSDGCLYVYCLKGNEDIRMDERVMQLFGMVNVLLGQSRTSNNAQIHRFPVIPISNNIGLVSGVWGLGKVNLGP